MRFTAATPPRLAMKALRSTSMLTSCADLSRRRATRGDGLPERLRPSRGGFNGKAPHLSRHQPLFPNARLSQYLDYLGMNSAPELLHGTLDTLVLKTLAGGRRHGYAIARAIEEATEGVVFIEEGSLY